MSASYPLIIQGNIPHRVRHHKALRKLIVTANEKQRASLHVNASVDGGARCVVSVASAFAGEWYGCVYGLGEQCDC